MRSGIESASERGFARVIESGSSASCSAFTANMVTISAGDRPEDDQGVAVLEIVALEARGVKHQSPVECERDRRQHENPEQVLRRGVERVERRGEKGERERGEASVEQQLGRAHRQNDEAPEDQRVHRARHRVAQDLLLQERDRDDVLQANEHMAAAIVRLRYAEVGE